MDSLSTRNQLCQLAVCVSSTDETSRRQELPMASIRNAQRNFVSTSSEPEEDLRTATTNPPRSFMSKKRTSHSTPRPPDFQKSRSWAGLQLQRFCTVLDGMPRHCCANGSRIGGVHRANLPTRPWEHSTPRLRHVSFRRGSKDNSIRYLRPVKRRPRRMMIAHLGRPPSLNVLQLRSSSHSD